MLEILIIITGSNCGEKTSYEFGIMVFHPNWGKLEIKREGAAEKIKRKVCDLMAVRRLSHCRKANRLEQFLMSFGLECYLQNISQA